MNLFREYEKLLLARGYIEPRPEEQGGSGSNYILTPCGSSLLSLIDSSIPGNDHPRQVLDEQEDALAEAEITMTLTREERAGANHLKKQLGDQEKPGDVVPLRRQKVPPSAEDLKRNASLFRGEL